MGALLLSTKYNNLQLLYFVTNMILWHLGNMLTLAVCMYMYCNECCIAIICMVVLCEYSNWIEYLLP